VEGGVQSLGKGYVGKQGCGSRYDRHSAETDGKIKSLELCGLRIGAREEEKEKPSKDLKVGLTDKCGRTGEIQQ